MPLIAVQEPRVVGVVIISITAPPSSHAIQSSSSQPDSLLDPAHPRSRRPSHQPRSHIHPDTSHPPPRPPHPTHSPPPSSPRPSPHPPHQHPSPPPSRPTSPSDSSPSPSPSRPQSGPPDPPARPHNAPPTRQARAACLARCPVQGPAEVRRRGPPRRGGLGRESRSGGPR